MLRLLLSVASLLMLLPAWSCTPAPGPTFRITLDREVARQPQSGRLVVYLIREGAKVEPGSDPADGPFWSDPQPLFGVNITNLLPGSHVDIVKPGDAFPVPPHALPPGRYRAQAVLDVRSEHSDWKREPGNFFSDPIEFELGGAGQAAIHELRLTNIVPPRDIPEIYGVEIVEVRSPLLSQFHGRDVFLRAAVILPVNHNPERAYPAIYEVPGFGGDHHSAFELVRQRAEYPPGSPAAALAAGAFWIVLDPESANGHTLFADSANNGPRGQALVQELIPAIEARYTMIGRPTARILRGHSSGGWSTIWLAITHPDVFGAIWSTAPDPVDFRRFQLVNIYEQESMYIESGKDIPSYRVEGQVKMSIRQENLMEQVLGPMATSGQQWASWQAVYGPRRPAGGPVPLYDPHTGRINREVAESYRAFDIGEHVRTRPDAALAFRQRIRLVIGDQDSYYLEEAVALLEQDLGEIQFLNFPEGEHGYIKIIPGHDHSSIKDDPAVRAFQQEMLDHLERHGHRAPR
jgi:pimeloyl-ACP methyl ester carboxylesterase